MNALECAFFGSLARDVELKTAKSGKPWASLLVMVDTGEEKPQLVQTAIFGDAAEKLSGAPRGTRVYCEGSLKTSQWAGADGETRYGLSCAASKCERVGTSAIGRNRPRQQHESKSPSPPHNGQPLPLHTPAAPPQYSGAPDFDDALPF
jgi:single-stranded DNA-binding protein